MQTELYGKQVETFIIGVSVSTGLTYLQQLGLKQLLTCVWQTPEPLVKTQALNIFKQCTEQHYVVFFIYLIKFSLTHLLVSLDWTAYGHTSLGWSKLLHNLQ